ncbi:copper resistance CopC family protein [Streptomyces yerevanensis]|uniref:copper resistance CopC family protein n=1 Tax=Streptomyces yerevanensis TaxID=66378 RepID=UPI0005259C96|nr:copper resistance CopC family protein [Streptomyces yerevanensis]
MNAIHRRAAHTAARTLVAPAAALAILAGPAPQAAAHTELDTSSPGADATLAGLPPRVTLSFSDAMTQKYAKVAVTGPDGASAATAEPQITGKTVTLPLDTAAPAGRYTVGYRVVSADGHPVSGSYTFTVKETGSPSPSPSTTESVGRAAPRAARESVTDQGDEESSGVVVRILVAAGALAVAAIGAFVSRRRRAGHGR